MVSLCNVVIDGSSGSGGLHTGMGGGVIGGDILRTQGHHDHLG